MKHRNRFLAVVAGIAVGLLVGFVLPAGWVFVEDPMVAHADHDGDGTKYACPMHCTVMDEMPADRRCPVCGMELAPVSSASTLSAEERRMIGLRAEPLRREPLTRGVRVVGEVDYDETRLARITTRMSGWLERVWADTTWTEVKAGEKLASIYSPELYAAQKEFLVATDASGGREDATGAALLHAAERRLELLGIGKEEIAELRAKRAVQESLILRSPLDGVLVERHAVQGESVRTGARLYTVADLSRVWIQAEVFERDLVWIFEGQRVTLQTGGIPLGTEGRVAFVDPVIDRRSRTARVRIEVENPAGEAGTRMLRIGQRVDAWIEARVDADGRPAMPGAAAGSAPLVLPRSAVLSTGRRTVIYLLFAERMGKRDYRLDPDRLPEPVYYQMVPVRVGAIASGSGSLGRDLYPLLGLDLSAAEKESLQIDELAEGLLVVTQGNLLLDSQAQLSGKPSLLFPEGSRGSSDPHAGHGR